MSSAKSLVELRRACDHWKVGDSVGFQRIVSSFLDQLGSYQRDLAITFEVSSSTISRWARGTAKPHRLVQRLIIDRLRDAVVQASGKKTGG